MNVTLYKLGTIDPQAKFSKGPPVLVKPKKSAALIESLLNDTERKAVELAIAHINYLWVTFQRRNFTTGEFIAKVCTVGAELGGMWALRGLVA